ncbi:MAG TPA: 4Fe-4S binding protein [Bacillota bacterium]|nr:4Fe-4S binding protein [Bacillota bacterium]
MCEFCHEHGEGKKWYLQMKNYSEELLHETLTPEQQKIVNASTRQEWNQNFFEWFVLPAIENQPEPAQNEQPKDHNTAPEEKLSASEELRRRKMTHFGQVIPIEDVEKVIEIADSITRFPCGCRYFNTGKSDKRYCFGLGKVVWGFNGQFPDAASGLEVLGKKEALKMIRDFDKEGLMHSIWTGVTPFIGGLCNCDRDCGAYRGYIENDGLPTFFHGEYIAQVNWDLCNGCKSCMRQCQFGAMFYSSILAKVHINETKCFGCGVCRVACHKKAIALIPRSENPETADIWVKKGSYSR